MKPIPTLSLTGWVTEPVAGMSELLATYFSNKASQSDLFDVKSIMMDLARYPDDIGGLCSQVQTSLTALYTPYFPEGCDIEVTNKLYEEPYRNYHLIVSINCTSGGKVYSLANTYEKYEGGFKALTEKSRQQGI